ncbi:MAG: transglycosylase domain-containing protein, partial [Gammaproteobacteria bacterium]|nr:transglycosylase domain-containing protein [Gammaproteobacteria bacterium]
MRRLLTLIIWLGASGVCATVLILAGVYLYLDPKVPEAQSYRYYKPETPLRVYTRDHALLAEFGERRLIPVVLKDVPLHFVQGLLNTEDKRFYQHRGIDYISLANDAVGLVMNPTIRAGASTITMQLARNISFSLERTFIRKFKEMLLALEIERELTKDQILELYINIVPFGKRAYGVQAAAYTYYGKPVWELGLAQLAMLAGIPKRPTAGNPINGPEWALRRRNLVLSRMYAQGSIDRAAFDQASAAPITARVHQRDLDLTAAYSAEWVRQKLVRRYGTGVYSSGYEVRTTLDATLQTKATNAVRAGLIAYTKRHGYRGAEGRLDIDSGAAGTDRAAQYLAALKSYSTSGGLQPVVVVDVADLTFHALRKNGEVAIVHWDGMSWARRFIDVDSRGREPKQAADIVAVGDVVRLHSQAGRWQLAQIPQIQGALAAMEPSTGAITALVGGFDFNRNQYNHALQAARQPGSSFKPFVYSAALANGVTPASIYLDAPLVFDDVNLETTYRPRNDSGRYNGPTRLREALYRSINLVSMRVLLDVGASSVLDYVGRFGFDTRGFPRNTQLAIGGGTMAVTPLEMLNAYAMLANGGYAVQPHIIERIEDQSGQIIFEPRFPEVCNACDEPPPLALEEPPPLALEAEGETEPAIIPAPRMLDERNVFIMNSMLQDVIRRGTGRRAGRELARADIAGKTGTT